MLESMGKRTPPFGTPDLNCRFVDVWFLNGVSLGLMCVLFLNVMELLSCCGGRLCARPCIVFQ